MTVAIGDVGCRGRVDLTFRLQAGRTVLSDSYCEVPFKTMRLFNNSPGSELAHLILMHSTAGVFGGDRLECRVHVETGARVRMTQQSATKVHPSGGRQAQQTTHIELEAGAELIYDWDPVIPFADSRLCQKTWIEAAQDSSLVFWEGFMAGRIGKNELWKFAEITSETRLNVNGLPIYLERFGLFPGRKPLDQAWVAGNACYFGTGLYFGPEASRVAEHLHDALPDSGVDSPAPNLAVARVVSAYGPDFHRSRSIFVKR